MTGQRRPNIREMATDKRMQAHRELSLMRELATTDASYELLAGRYGITETRVKKFAEHFADAIAEIAADPQNPLAGLWAAKRENRIASLTQDVERIDDQMHQLDRIDAVGKADTTHRRVSLMRLRKELLYAIGHEMAPGERANVGNSYVYVVEADDFEGDLT